MPRKAYIRVFCYALFCVLVALLSSCGDSDSSDEATPALVIDKSTASFHLKAGEASAFKSLSLSTNNGTSPAFSISDISVDAANWLTVESLGGITAPAEILITVDTVGAGLASNIIHSETIVFSANGFQSVSLKVMLSIDLYDIKVSSASDRSLPIPLEGATLSGNAYIFVSPNSDIKLVNFFYDTVDTTTTPYQIEDEIFYDFETTIDVTLEALPFDTTDISHPLNVSNGAHFIFVQIVHPDDSIDTLRSDFVISN